MGCWVGIDVGIVKKVIKNVRVSVMCCVSVQHIVVVKLGLTGEAREWVRTL